MNMKELIERQAIADEKRGFTLEFNEPSELFKQVNADLVGLIGEIGEFANLLKKVELNHKHDLYIGPTMEESREALLEELSDASIYIFRISLLLNGDLEQKIISKMDINDERYRHLE